MMAASGKGIRGKGGREEAGAGAPPESAGSEVERQTNSEEIHRQCIREKSGRREESFFSNDYFLHLLENVTRFSSWIELIP